MTIALDARRSAALPPRGVGHQFELQPLAWLPAEGTHYRLLRDPPHSSSVAMRISGSAWVMTAA